MHVHSKLYSAFRIFVYVVFATLKPRFGDLIKAALTNDLECCTHKPRLDSLHAIQRRVNNATRLKKKHRITSEPKYPGGAKNTLQIHFAQPVQQKNSFLDLFKMT